MEYLIICAISGMWAGYVGKSKGSSAVIWFVIGAIVPFLGVLIAVLYRREDDELRRQCPRCGNVVPLYDQVCTRCGLDLEFPDVAIEPSSGIQQH